MTTPGNHEIWWDFTPYKARFRMPDVDAPTDDEQNMYYSLDVGGVHLVGLNTESPLDFAHVSRKQVEWLKADLATASPRSVDNWTIAFGHRPLYCSNAGHSKLLHGMKELQDKLEDTLAPSVDLFVSGHVHDYERTLPVLHKRATSTNYSSPAAPVYVVNGAAGNRESNAHPPGNQPWEPKSAPQVQHQASIINN